MPTAYVKPALGADGQPLLVRQPDHDWLPLPPEGGFVVLDEYWSRRIRDRDVIETEPPSEPPTEPEPVEPDPDEPAALAEPETPSERPARAGSRSR